MSAGHSVYLLCLGRVGQPPVESRANLTAIRLFPETTTVLYSLFPEADNQAAPWGNLLMTRTHAGRLRVQIRLGKLKISLSMPGCRKPVFRPPPLPQADQDLHRFYDRYWGEALQRFVADYGIETLHVHDLPLVYTALCVAQSVHIPVIADFHENWPALVHINRQKYRGWREKHRNRKARWQRLEALCAAASRHIVVVTETAKQRLMTAHVPPSRITVVSNTVDVERFLATPVRHDLVSRYADRFVVSYIGGFGPHRGIETLLEAGRLLMPLIPDFHLFLAGADSLKSADYLNRCKAMAHSLGLSQHCTFTGWAEDQDFATYITLSRVGVIPHRSNEHTETTMPNKLFQYMAMARPIVCSNLAPLRQVVEPVGCGLTFPADNAAALSQCLLRLYQQPQQANTMGIRGREAVFSTYNWSMDARQLCSVYQAGDF
jgi:glycosyltransferase involved in cell wall biosynthesis